MLYAHCESGSAIVTVKTEVLPEIKVLVQVNAHTPGRFLYVRNQPACSCMGHLFVLFSRCK